MRLKYSEILKLTDEQLIEKYDQVSPYDENKFDIFVNEMTRRSNVKTNKIMVKYTFWITIMTAVMLICTIANIVIAFI